MSGEILFTEAIRDESDEYLRRFLRNKRTDVITMMHKQAVQEEIARRRRLRARPASPACAPAG